nr:hypothetical protein [Mycobacterium gordonae]
MDSRTIYQLIADALLAQESFQIDNIVPFNARYSHTYAWRLDTLLHEMSGEPVAAKTLSVELDRFPSNLLDPRVPAPAREAAMKFLVN